MTKMRLLAAATLLVAATVDASNAKGEAFLQENKLQEGVITLPSGLQYKVIQAAANMSSPTPSASTPCECHYEGRTIDGTVSVIRNRSVGRLTPLPPTPHLSARSATHHANAGSPRRWHPTK